MCETVELSEQHSRLWCTNVSQVAARTEEAEEEASGLDSNGPTSAKVAKGRWEDNSVRVCVSGQGGGIIYRPTGSPCSCDMFTTCCQ